jgi:hypothetical protein
MVVGRGPAEVRSFYLSAPPPIPSRSKEGLMGLAAVVGVDGSNCKFSADRKKTALLNQFGSARNRFAFLSVIWIG